MFPLSAGAAFVIGFFQLDISVSDTRYTATSGQDMQAITDTRIIKGAVDASNSTQLQNLFGGNVSDGSIGIYTNDILHIDDQYVINNRNMQSFITYGVYIYRVTQVASWDGQASARVYLAERHVTQDLI